MEDIIHEENGVSVTHPAPPGEEYWTQLDGTKIAVGDMSITHLRNTLRLIIRRPRERAIRAQVLKKLDVEYEL